jgi:hypothetical protein
MLAARARVVAIGGYIGTYDMLSFANYIVCSLLTGFRGTVVRSHSSKATSLFVRVIKNRCVSVVSCRW